MTMNRFSIKLAIKLQNLLRKIGREYLKLQPPLKEKEINIITTSTVQKDTFIELY